MDLKQFIVQLQKRTAGSNIWAKGLEFFLIKPGKKVFTRLASVFRPKS